jgi:RNA polymerase sigma-70 factor (ECF subfamily)
VESALGHLSREEREAIDLAFFGGLNQRELAETLAVPVSNLGTRIGRALVNFRNLLDTGAS